MNPEEKKNLIKKYLNFLNEFKTKEIRAYQNGKTKDIVIDLFELASYNPELTDKFISDPVTQLKTLQICLKSFNGLEDLDYNIQVKGVDELNPINISHIRQQDENKLISIKGMIKRKSSTYAKLVTTEYLCTNVQCDYSQIKIKLKQNEDKVKTLKYCPKCKASTNPIKDILEDYQEIYLEEIPDELNNSSVLPEMKMIELYGSITEPLNIEKFNVGGKVEVVGIIKRKAKTVNNSTSVINYYVIEAININSLEENIFTIEISEEDKTEFEEMSKNENILRILENSVAPSIAGREQIKQGTLLYIVGGTKHENTKDLIHILTIGNPGVGKSVMLKRLKKLLPRAIYISAENATGAGMIGATVKDSISGSWTIEAGAMVQANKGYFLIDEFDKTTKSDQDHLHQGLEHQEVTINKAGILANLKTYCPVYAVANPRYSKFDENKDYAKQLTFKTSLLSRFDLIFVIDSKDTESEHKEIMNRVLRKNKNSDKNILSDEKLRKYLMYAKTYQPMIPENLLDELEIFFNKIYHKSKDNNTIEIGYRQLSGLMRLSEGFAKLRLSNEVSQDDIQKAMNLMAYTLSKFSVSEIETGMSSKTRSISKRIEMHFEKLFGESNKVTLEELRKSIQHTDSDISETEMNRAVDELKKQTQIFEPTKNTYRQLM